MFPTENKSKVSMFYRALQSNRWTDVNTDKQARDRPKKCYTICSITSILYDIVSCPRSSIQSEMLYPKYSVMLNDLYNYCQQKYRCTDYFFYKDELKQP